MDQKKTDTLEIRLSDDVMAVTDELTDLRRLVHRHPELAHREERTQRIVIDKLTEVGIGARPFAGTGAAGVRSIAAACMAFRNNWTKDSATWARAAGSAIKSLRISSMTLGKPRGNAWVRRVWVTPSAGP